MTHSNLARHTLLENQHGYGYKVLRTDRQPVYGCGQWPPAGVWRKVTGKLEACANGIHVARLEDLPFWIDGAYQVWFVEYRGKVLIQKHKIVVSEARLLTPMHWEKEHREKLQKYMKKSLRYLDNFSLSNNCRTIMTRSSRMQRNFLDNLDHLLWTGDLRTKTYENIAWDKRRKDPKPS